jgi:predicted dehydrogenase
LVSGLVIGYGSIGRLHLRVVASYYENSAVIDIDPQALGRAELAHPGVVTATSLDELGATGWEWADTTAVIANWGPVHGSTVDKLLELGVKRLICEKPLAHSIAVARKMVDAAERNDARLAVHHPRRYNGLPEGIVTVADNNRLGPPYAFVVHGGAAGLITNGIHFIDIAAQLFDANPESVISTARGERINPRSDELLFYGGSAIWQYSGGRELVLSMTNHSSVATRIFIYYRDAIVELMSNSNIRVVRRLSEEIERFPAVTRLGAPSDVIFEGPVPGFIDPDTALIGVHQELNDAGTLTFGGRDALSSIEACIGALAAGDSGRSIKLPLDPNDEYTNTEWPIS